jgi:hypothetical protein
MQFTSFDPRELLELKENLCRFRWLALLHRNTFELKLVHNLARVKLGLFNFHIFFDFRNLEDLLPCWRFVHELLEVHIILRLLYDLCD